MASQSPINVFVYGTLLFPEVTDRLGVASIDPRTSNRVSLVRRVAVLDGFERFTVRLRSQGNFPAIVPGDGAVQGELLQGISSDSLDRLDYFEGIADGHYRRETVTVRCEDEHIVAFAYVCGDTLREYLDGRWDPASFRKNDLSWYISNVVDPL